MDEVLLLPLKDAGNRLKEPAQIGLVPVAFRKTHRLPWSRC